MIHSLAGGELKNEVIFDLAKLEFCDLPNQYFWYIVNDSSIKANDFVYAPFGILDELKKAKVIEIKINVNSKNFPISLKKLKNIYKKC